MSAVARLGRYLFTSGFLFLVWFLLSGKGDVFHLGAGAASALAITALFFPWQGGSGFPIGRFAAFVPWHLLQVILSNLRVARLVFSRRRAIDPRVLRLPPGLADERALALLGCAITLTPGTLTLDVSGGELIVHALDEASAKEIEEGIMARRVGRVFGEGGA
jgi:multisubunit Na+/H+ antiporter MnhE subunit